MNCEQTFATQENLVAHLRQVTRGWQAREHCFICDYLSINAEDLTEHLQLLHPEQDLSTTYICQECQVRFKSEREADCHARTCEMNINFEEELSKHVETGNADKLGYCFAVKIENIKGSIENFEKVLVVENNSTTLPKRELPKRAAKKSVNVTSKTLEKTIQLENNYQENVRAVKNITENEENSRDKDSLEKIYQFFNSQDLKEIQKGYNCPDCNKTYTSYMSAKVHLQTICNKEADKLCHLCDYRTRQMANLNRHLKLIHSAPELYICDQCGKEFKKKGHFNHHINFDCGTAKPFKCPLCDYVTKIPGKLNTHLLKVHNKLNLKIERKQRRSTLLEGLPEPIKVPEGYECPDCGIVVKLPEGYKKHRIRVHLGEERNFNCLVKSCDYTTNNNHNLKQHLKRVHLLFSRVRNEQLELLDNQDEDSRV